MENEKALVAISGGALMESEVISEAIAFAQKGFGGMPVTLPKGYDISRAVKNFCFALPNVTNIEIATKESIFQAAHEYITKGFDIGKKQCALIVYKDKDKNGNYTGTGNLTVQPQYFGVIAQVKRARPDVKRISEGTVIYKDEKIAIAYDEHGRLHVKHEPDFACWGNEIVGAYAVVTYEDGTTDTDLMTIAEIKTAWAQSRNGDKVHKAFPAEMARKTVLNRLCKKLLNKSDDSAIIEDIDEGQTIDDYETIDIDAEESYGVPVSPAFTAQEKGYTMPEPKPVEMPPEEETPQPQGDPDSEDYCITVPYREYKDNYSGCMADNYNPREKTIEVYPNKPKDKKGGEQ